jgi:CCR4-NOT transcriptional regulation complex NOT5 subunit
MHNQHYVEKPLEFHNKRQVSVVEETKIACIFQFDADEEAANHRKGICTTNVKTKAHRDTKDNPKRSSPGDITKCPVQNVDHAVLQSSFERPAKVKSAYPLPPTEIHDGRLFRKVG